MNRKSTLILTAVFILMSFWQLPEMAIYSQNKPLTLGQVTTSLNVSKDKKKESAITAKKVRQVGVTFPLTPEIESELRASGATNELIEAIRQNSPPIKPTQTPIVKSTPTTSGREIKNSIGMEFVKIPSGSFMMGSPTSEKDRSDDETQHKVTISKDFYLGKYEVTQGQWKAVMGNNPSKFSSCGDDCPVEQVSWDDVQEFIKKLNAKERIVCQTVECTTYRLPTEAEWEYATRAGTTTAFAFGDNLSSSQANFDGNYPYGNAAKGKYLEKTVEVGSYQPNSWGLYDMHGNVWEWVQDWYGKEYYSSSPSVDPTGPSSGSFRVFRGGCWNSGGRNLRSAFRNYYTPSYRSDFLGFRLLRMQ